MRFFLLFLIFVASLNAMDIIPITADNSFNFFFSFMFYVGVALTGFYVVAVFFI